MTLPRTIELAGDVYELHRIDAGVAWFRSRTRPSAFIRRDAPTQSVAFPPYDIPCIGRCGRTVTIAWPDRVSLHCEPCRVRWFPDELDEMRHYPLDWRADD